ncbi:hypothetical protein DO72_407 [Burkholderia pseudomallei]|nr:hypothetical protein DO72_407 [Burkholderia pseudomallei]
MLLRGAGILSDAVQVDDSAIALRRGLHHAKACHVRVGRTHFIIHDAFLAKTPGETTTWQTSPACLHPCVWLPVNFGKAGFIAASAERSMFAMHPPQVMGVQPLNDFHT